jgi:glycosyltransferase involved in cell wall biosynthesis
MTLSAPLVSIIIPTYNYALYLFDAVDSVLKSGFPANELEIIVIDDGSTDDSALKSEAYRDRVKYITQENSGKAWATKVGIEQARGEYVLNLDADDLFLPGKIQEVVDIFENEKEVVHVAHPAIHWNINTNQRTTESLPSLVRGRKVQGSDLLAYFYKRGILYGGGSTFAARAKILKSIPIPRDVDMLIDEYLVIMTLQHGFSFFIDHPLSIWRIHGENFSRDTANFDQTQFKLQRRLRALIRIGTIISASGIGEEVKKLYFLKNMVAILGIKEELGQKSINDILNLWLYICNNFSVFRRGERGTLINYKVLNRTLPTIAVRVLKTLRCQH